MSDIDAVAVTAGPGLVGALIVGVASAKAIALGLGIPIYGVNHLAAHVMVDELEHGPLPEPVVGLLVSGGHSSLISVRDGHFEALGHTLDDAAGEAFDKVARLLGLGQPGGPAIELTAQSGDPQRFALPRPLLDRDGCDLSFSGLKTAVMRARNALVESQGGLFAQDQADLAAGFQSAVVDVLAEKSRRAMLQFLDLNPAAPAFCVAGGVAANRAIRQLLETVSVDLGAVFIAPPMNLCTDNAAMIAYAAIEQSALRDADGLKLSARPRWPLDARQPAMLGSGKKGAKA